MIEGIDGKATDSHVYPMLRLISVAQYWILSLYNHWIMSAVCGSPSLLVRLLGTQSLVAMNVLDFGPPGQRLMITSTVRDTENLPFSADTPHRFSEGSRAAIRGRPCGNSRIVSAAMRGRSEDLEEVRG